MDYQQWSFVTALFMSGGCKVQHRTWVWQHKQFEDNTPPQSSGTDPDSGLDPEETQQLTSITQHTAVKQKHHKHADTNLLQGQDEFVESSPLWQCDFGGGHVVEQSQDRDLIRSDPVFDPEHVSVDHSVRHHRVKIQIIMHTRHSHM